MDKIETIANVDERTRSVLTAEALAFLTDLHRRFDTRRRNHLQDRTVRQTALDSGDAFTFLAETADVRSGSWTVDPPPADLADRRCEITGPTDRKMVINALNSGARVFMADFEDSNSPTWSNLIEGQINLSSAIRRTIDFTADTGKRYELNADVATLMVRPGRRL